ncbi:MAG: CPBP family intramembrane metalloprotease [Puniceicoccales bacterium]|jgi:membrane protease YdiL (CAAX protease family)|nr:CPBP family intramembrane metalloprotease [Puniceicoccales bacterium]
MKSIRGNNPCAGMRGTVLLLLFYASTLLLAAVIAPMLFFGAKYCAEIFSGGPFQHFMGKGFCKFFDRARLIAFAILLVPFVKISGVKISRDPWFRKVSPLRALWTFIAGFVLLCALFAWFDRDIAAGAFKCAAGKVLAAPLTAKLMLGAVAIGLCEEIIFRGFALRLLLMDFKMPFAIAIGSLFFAHCHIGASAAVKISPADVTIFSGFRCLVPAAFGSGGISDLQNYANLVAFGTVLSLLLVRFGSIWYPIAYHSGAVFAIAAHRAVARTIPGYHCCGALSSSAAFAVQILLILLLSSLPINSGKR